jgi:predicted transcriptional regulator
MRDKSVEPERYEGLLPPQVLNLARCEREVAVIIYLEGSATAKTIEARLPRKLSNGAIRSMLGRMCKKGILKRRKITGSHTPQDRRIPYLYSPAITPDAVKNRALLEVAQDYFGGSLAHLAQAAERVLQQSVEARFDPKLYEGERQRRVGCAR